MKSTIALCLKKCMYLNLKNNLLLKKNANHHLSLQYIKDH